MNILQVSKTEVLGGAERVAYQLYEGCVAQRERCWLAVGEKRTADPHVLEMPGRGWSRAMRRLLPERTATIGPLARRLREYAVNPGALRRAVLGQDSFAFPGARTLLSLPPARPDVVHLHNLHGSYFDLRTLPQLAAQVPVVATMHDAWLLTGGCTHPLDCTRYLDHCGKCPHQSVHFRASVIDSTAYNHRRKRRVLARSQLHLITPSRWLMDKVASTMLEPAVKTRRVIPNGVDTRIFRPADRGVARAALHLPAHAHIILHASATPTRNASKDFPTMLAAIRRLAPTFASVDNPLVFLVIGESGDTQPLAPHTEIRFIPFTPDPAAMARCYAAADIYLQASIADTFPNTVLEAMACAVPVVATAVGGIPEQVIDGQTGLLVDPRTPESLAPAIESALASLLTDPTRRAAMAENALLHVRSHFTLDQQIQAHLALYCELCEVR